MIIRGKFDAIEMLESIGTPYAVKRMVNLLFEKKEIRINAAFYLAHIKTTYKTLCLSLFPVAGYFAGKSLLSVFRWFYTVITGMIFFTSYVALSRIFMRKERQATNPFRNIIGARREGG